MGAPLNHQVSSAWRVSLTGNRSGEDACLVFGITLFGYTVLYVISQPSTNVGMNSNVQNGIPFYECITPVTVESEEIIISSSTGVVGSRLESLLETTKQIMGYFF